MSQQLQRVFNSFHPLTEEEFGHVWKMCEHKSYEKDEYILKEGQVCSGIYFVDSGIVRLFELKDGKEIHKNFFFPGSSATEFTSLTQQVPTQMNLVALEPTKIVFLSRKGLLDLYKVAPAFESMGRKLLEQLVVENSQLASMYTSMTPKERYQHIVDNKPELLQHIPLQYLASYLGMARETLSRIRKDF